jgi:hypothetical protein
MGADAEFVAHIAQGCTRLFANALTHRRWQMWLSCRQRSYANVVVQLTELALTAERCSS